MRRLWWLGLCGALWMLSACEQDEGDSDAGDAGEVGGDAGDTGDTGDTTPTGPACSDPSLLADSCAAAYFSCFDASGTCSIATRANVGDAQIRAIVFESGAEWEVRYDNVTGARDDIAKNSNGAVCASASTTQMPQGARDSTFTPDIGSDTLRMQIDGSGNMLITCPDASQESYTSTERATFLQCLGASCNGEVPFVN